MREYGKAGRYRQQIFVAAVFISFVTVYFFNLLTPQMSDDLLFDKSLHQSLGDVLRQEYISYMTHTGRTVLDFIRRIFMIFPKTVFDLFNSLVFVGAELLIYWNIKERKKYDVFLYVLINLCMWTLCVEFAQTVLWLAGACNYIWGIFIILGFISLYRYYMEKGTGVKYKPMTGTLLFLSGILAGWCNENTSGGAILIILLLTAKYYLDHKKIEKCLFAGIMGAAAGFILMIAAPGNMVRGSIVAEGENYSGLARYISRGLKIFKAVDEYLLIYMVAVCLLGAYFYYAQKYVLREFYEVTVFAVASLATAVVLIMTTEPMPRAYFGANIFMMIAALQMIQKVREEEVFMIALKNGGMIAAVIAMIFVYVEEGANLVRIRREVEIRENYIREETAKGNCQLVLPALRTEFESKYSWAHDIDISNDAWNWNNDIYEIYYGIEVMEVLPWDEWEKRVEKSMG